MKEIWVALFILTIGIYRITELLLLERNKQPGKIQARWTLFLIVVVNGLTLLSSASEFIMVDRKINIYFVLAGFGLILAKIPVKVWAAKTLGRYWSSQIEIRADHHLVRKGPYEYLRHPAYLVAITDALGIPLLVNAYYTLVSVSVLMVALILVRMSMEEKALIRKFGEEYKAYMRDTFALLPLRKQWFQ